MESKTEVNNHLPLRDFDATLLDILQVPQNRFFGLSAWLDFFPDDKIIFPDLTLPGRRFLEHNVAISVRKTLAQALSEGDYFAYIIPESINDHSLSLSFLECLFPDKSEPRFYFYSNKSQHYLLGHDFYCHSFARPGLYISPLTANFSGLHYDYSGKLTFNDQFHLVPRAVEEAIKQFSFYLLNKKYPKVGKIEGWGNVAEVSRPGHHVSLGAVNQSALVLSDFPDKKASDIGLFLTCCLSGPAKKNKILSFFNLL